jgi:hypothetical protein
MFSRIFLTLLLAGPVAWAATVQLDDDGMAIINGERTFILGLYETPKEAPLLQEIAGAGFNLVRAPGTLEALDELHAAGLWAWLVTGNAIDLSESTAEREALLRALVEAFADHPALAVWEVPDEALWNAWYLAEQWRASEPGMLEERIAKIAEAPLKEKLQQQWQQMRELRRLGEYTQAEPLADALWEQLGEESPQAGFGLANAPERAARMAEGFLEGYRLLKRLDPLHPVWMNHAPRNSIEDLALFNRAADVVGCDIYPVPEALDVRHSDLGDRTLSAVGAYTARMQAAAPGKPVWMVLQGSGWGDFLDTVDDERREALRRPTREETRFMAYDAIARGAQGVLYWGTFYVEKDSAFWKELCGVIHELHTLQPVLSAPDAPLPLTVTHAPAHGSVDRGIIARAKAAPSGTWLLLVNEWTSPLTAVIGGLESLEGTHYQDAETGRKVTVEGGALRIPMPRQSVLLLEPRQD